MSHEIVYNSQFIKTKEGKIIPLALSGSNNCTEMTLGGKERRARDWSAIYFNNQNQMIDKTELEIMERIEGFTGGEYQQHFVKNSKYVDDKGLISFFKNNIKKVKTIEEMQETYYNCNALRGYLSIWQEHSNSHEGIYYIKDSEELENFLNAARLRIESKKENESIYVCLGFQCEKFEPKVKPVKKDKERLSEYYAIMVEGSGYLTKITSRNLKYSYGLSNNAKQFKTEEAANKYLETLLQKKYGCRLEVKYITG